MIANWISVFSCVVETTGRSSKWKDEDNVRALKASREPERDVNELQFLSHCYPLIEYQQHRAKQTFF